MGNVVKRKKTNSSMSSRSSHNGSTPQSVSAAMENIPLTETGEPVFSIDIRPTKVNLASIPVQGEKAAAPPETRMNRDSRRRLEQIERYRKEVKRSLHIPEDSAETTKEVESRVAAWSRSQDAKKVKREDSKHSRRKAKAQAADARMSKEMKKRTHRRR